MHEMKEKLIKAGTDILNASKTELYVSMRFLDIALNSLGYEMDLSMKTIGTDSQKIRFNPRYLIENYQNDSVLVNRAYLHIKNAICIPNELISNKEIAELPDKSQEILVYCRSGSRSRQAANKLIKLGYENVIDFGGIIDWDGEVVK